MKRCTESMMNKARITEGLGHAAIVAASLTLFVVLVWLYWAPSGTFVAWADTLERSPYINRILPVDRVPASVDDQYVIMLDDPAYFTARVPNGNYKSADVTIYYRNHEQPIFKLGVITNVVTNSFDLRALDNFVVDSSDWQESTVNFDITELPRTNGMIKFILSAPQVKAGGHSVDIKRFKIVWHK